MQEVSVDVWGDGSIQGEVSLIKINDKYFTKEGEEVKVVAPEGLKPSCQFKIDGNGKRGFIYFKKGSVWYSLTEKSRVPLFADSIKDSEIQY